jgi:hypothetical protein
LKRPLERRDRAIQGYQGALVVCCTRLKASKLGAAWSLRAPADPLTVYAGLLARVVQRGLHSISLGVKHGAPLPVEKLPLITPHVTS